jgi:membrane protein implicated in regulation of membrane protease activity
MGAYILFLYLGATLAPLLGGFIYAGMTWQAVLVSVWTIVLLLAHRRKSSNILTNPYAT